ncbi:MAG: alanine--tRNA ligase [Candidatus Aenigmarchaeota archaeon ex4484_14]|nr:MAG: alanine--tRNA ligase [Candidatus Aenigmarchaeota archaeon ex4484_14]
MDIKKQLIQKFQKDPEKYWTVELFREKGFVRKKCPKCGKFFWSLGEQEVCGDPPCVEYGFIGDSPVNEKTDYVQTWKKIERFFIKNGHTSIQPYPTVCRWFPGLYFTIASIVAFQRKTGDKTVFEMPANPLIIPQPCLRFNDIPNVGITGRHYTSFVMVGQHSISNGNGYWKDKCVELDYNLLTKTFGIDENEITFIEDAWVGPSAFGYSLEYFVRGLELGNAVFTEFVGTPEKYSVMKDKVIDMGAGLERFSWISQGTPTSYDATFGPALDELKKHIDYDKKLFLEYSKIAGNLNFDEVRNIKQVRSEIAKHLGLSVSELEKKIAPVEAAYIIADHTKTLLLAIKDGGIPSNVGGGYNLRVLMRRAFGFKERFDFDIDLTKIVERHAQYLEKMYPGLKESVENFNKIKEIERRKFEETKKRTASIVAKVLGKKISDKEMLTLYESHGVTPEMIEEASKEKNKKTDIPTDFYSMLSERHMKEKERPKIIDTTGVEKTKIMFYEDVKEFEATVLKVKDSWVILDQTAFYPESGGQESDTGFFVIDGKKIKVTHVEKVGDVVLHKTNTSGIKEGQKIRGVIDWQRRQQLAKHHTATHIVNYAARLVLGEHVNQAGAKKSTDKAHLDITHYKTLSQEEEEEIEKKANEIVKKALPVKKEVMSRMEAEQKYGMRIYQGGPVPEEMLRIISIGDDHEACGGTHLSNTKDVDKIIIASTERIQDGIIRITFMSGPAADKYEKRMKALIKEICDILGCKADEIISQTEELVKKWKSKRKEKEKAVRHAAKEVAATLEKKIENNVIIEKLDKNAKELQEISRLLTKPGRVIILFGTQKENAVDVFGASDNKNVNIGEIVSKVCKELGGRGGGSPNVAQGFGTQKEKIDKLIRKLERELR